MVDLGDGGGPRLWTSWLQNDTSLVGELRGGGGTYSHSIIGSSPWQGKSDQLKTASDSEEEIKSRESWRGNSLPLLMREKSNGSGAGQVVIMVHFIIRKAANAKAKFMKTSSRQ